MAKDERIVYPENGGRSEEYRQHLQEILASGECPFCLEHIDRNKKKPLIKRGFWWDVYESDYFYDGARFQFLLVFKEHTIDIDELPTDALVELKELITGLKMEFNFYHSTLILRSGGPATGATVAHLHANLVVAKEDEICLTRV